MQRYAVLIAVLSLSLIKPALGYPGASSMPVSADQVASPGEAPSGSSAAPAEKPLSRWLDVDALSFTMRYRSSFDTFGTKIFDDIQQRSLLSAKLKFDKEGKYFVGFRAESGRYFNWAFADFSGLDYSHAIASTIPHLTYQHGMLFLGALRVDRNWGTVARSEVARGWQFNMRDLYLSATPVKWLTLEFGGIPIVRGASTEITSYDEDGYISGERVSIHAPEHLYVDKISVTSAYLGDLFNPNFFNRYDRLTQSNYRQVLAEKHWGSRVKASVDYTWQDRTNTIREAVLVKTPETRVLDSARFELYHRVNDVLLTGFLAHAANGGAFTGSKTLSKRVTLEGGYASVDNQDGITSDEGGLAAASFPLNGDSYQIGKRFFWRANVKVAPGTSLFGFYTHQIDSKATPLIYSYTRQNYNFGMQLDFKEMLQHAGIL